MRSSRKQQDHFAINKNLPTPASKPNGAFPITERQFPSSHAPSRVSHETTRLGQTSALNEFRSNHISLDACA